MHSKEEKANIITHALGLILAFGACYFLVKTTNGSSDILKKIAFTVYGLSIIFLFASSTLYHAASTFQLKRALRIADHVAIYFLIAGTYTPFLLVPLRGTWGWALLIVIWTLAIVGSILKLWYTGKYERISTAVYLGMGWLAIVAVKPMIESVPLVGLLWLIGGGLCYTVGVYFYNKRSWRYHHAIWHVFVLAGSGCHYISISNYI